MSRWKMQPLGWRRCRRPSDTPPVELLNPPEEDVPMEELLAKDENAWRRPVWMPGKTPSGRGAGS